MAEDSQEIHQPVLLTEVMEGLNIKPDGIYVDGTLGFGGHAESVLMRLSGKGRLIGFDQDLEALEKAKQRLSSFGDKFQCVHLNFSHIESQLQQLHIDSVDGVLLDLGVSSWQLDHNDRGFSFRFDGPLDMRMDKTQSLTAKDIVNDYSEDELEKIIRDWGEERWSKRIARRIVESRRSKKILTTVDLVEVIKAAVPYKGYQRLHPATRSFQAIRIAVNQELTVLTNVLPVAVSLLKPGGRLCVISFHSLEDRIVKQTFRRMAKEEIIKVLTKKPLIPSDAEVKVNPRARSSKMRVAERI